MSEIMSSGVWSYHNPVKIEAGPGSVEKLNQLVPSKGKILLVTCPGFTRRGLVAEIEDRLGADRLFLYDQVTPNPELDDLDKMTRMLRQQSIAGIIALGGGSVMDAAKVLAVTVPDQLEYPLETILRQGQKHTWKTKLPLVAIATTSGTGAEVTPFATVWDAAFHKKYSVTGDQVYPEYAILDPELTVTLSAKETLNTGLDAISHALESLWNKNRNPVSQAYAEQALELANRALPVVIEQPDNIEQRSRMQQASLLGGMAISQTRTAIAHSISYPLTSHFGVPHGLACSFTLPGIIDLYLSCCNEDEPCRQLMEDTKAHLLTLNPGALIQKYFSADAIDDIYTEMYSPERANNFPFSIDFDQLKKITLSSLL